MLKNKEEWSAAPIIGIFSIAVYGEAISYPAGAMIIPASANPAGND